MVYLTFGEIMQEGRSSVGMLFYPLAVKERGRWSEVRSI